MELTFKYKAGSDLPRRTFVVDATANWVDLTRNLQFSVTAPDGLAAEQVVRRFLTDAVAVITFRMDMVREITQGWNPETGRYDAPVVKVPFLYQPVINRVRYPLS